MAKIPMEVTIEHLEAAIEAKEEKGSVTYKCLLWQAAQPIVGSQPYTHVAMGAILTSKGSYLIDEEGKYLMRHFDFDHYDQLREELPRTVWLETDDGNS